MMAQKDPEEVENKVKIEGTPLSKKQQSQKETPFQDQEGMEIED